MGGRPRAVPELFRPSRSERVSAAAVPAVDRHRPGISGAAVADVEIDRTPRARSAGIRDGRRAVAAPRRAPRRAGQIVPAAAAGLQARRRCPSRHSRGSRSAASGLRTGLGPLDRAPAQQAQADGDHGDQRRRPRVSRPWSPILCRVPPPRERRTGLKGRTLFDRFRRPVGVADRRARPRHLEVCRAVRAAPRSKQGRNPCPEPMPSPRRRSPPSASASTTTSTSSTPRASSRLDQLELRPVGPRDVHLRILAVSLEHNVDHAVLADTVNITELRGGKIYPGNSALGEVIARRRSR